MKLSSIQYLRAVAAIGVVLNHAATSLFESKGALISADFGQRGVDLFFIISGFIMFYTTADDRMTPQIFLVRRLIRVVPLYFILTTVAFLMAVAAPHSVRTFSPNLFDYLRSILFIPYYNHIYDLVRPELGQGWTLNYEMFFYIIFALSLLLNGRIRLPVCIAIFSALSLLGIVGSFSGAVAFTYTDSLMMEFVFGMAIGYVVALRPADFSKSTLWANIVALAVIALWVFSYAPYPLSFRCIGIGIPSAAIVCNALWLERRGFIPNFPWLLLIGDASYSLYLSHTFVLAILRRLWARWFDILLISTHAMFIAVSVLVAIPLSIVLYRLLERPVTRWLMGYARKWHAQRELVTSAAATAP